MPALVSSNLAGCEYRESDQAKGTDSELLIQFKNGRVYAYSNVPKEIYDGLLQADSPGKYFNAFVKSAFPASRRA
jgi:hypothetical protein